MRIFATLTLASTLILMAVAAPAAAHGTSAAIDFPSGQRCYIYQQGAEHAEAPEFWRETNGDLSGDAEGLQRGPNGDTRYDEIQVWLSDCAAIS